MEFISSLNIYDIIMGIVSVSSLSYGVYSHFQSKKMSEAITTHGYLKKLAYEAYDARDYDRALGIFQKHYLNNDDKSELFDVIRSIFWKESRRIYESWIGSKVQMNSFITLVAQIDTSSIEERYSSVLLGLIEIYSSRGWGELTYWQIPIKINQGNYKNAICLANEYSFHKNTKINESLRNVVISYCESEMEKNTSNKSIQPTAKASAD